MTIRHQRDQIIYNFIREYVIDNGHSPNYSDIAKPLHISVRAAQESVFRLAASGLVSIDRHRERNIRVTDDELNFVSERSEGADLETQMLEEILRGLHRLKRERAGQLEQ